MKKKGKEKMAKDEKGECYVCERERESVCVCVSSFIGMNRHFMHISK